MKRGYLSRYFERIAAKRLSAVEVDPSRSNQHEFNGNNSLRQLFGSEDLKNHPAFFVWLGEEEGIAEKSFVTWYDARRNHPTRTEYRLYFKWNPVMEKASEGDLLIVARRPGGEIWCFVVKGDSTYQNQLMWLFGLEQIGFRFDYQAIEKNRDSKIGFAARYILENMGIKVEDDDTSGLEEIIGKYIQTGFPPSAEFSELARKSLGEKVSPLEEPDMTLLKWMEHEEMLFRTLEKSLLSQRLMDGFLDSDGKPDVDSFVSYALSVLNRRKSRVGLALENHIEEILKIHKIRYSKGAVTENRSRPDFIFPGIKWYHNLEVQPSNLTMLGVKSTCKDRWRQVLSEASRIEEKHLLTLEPGISEHQTDEMKAYKLQLVLPRSIHVTYKPHQQVWLMDLKSFIDLLKEKEMKI